MNLRLGYITALILLLLVTSHCFAQEVKVVQDLRQRSSIGIEKKVSQKLKIFGEIEAGFEKNISKFGKLYGELGASYSLKKNIEIEAKYKYTMNRKNFSTEFNYWHLFALSAEKKFKIEKYRLAYRIQYQNIDDEFLGVMSGVVKEQILKSRIKIKYNIKKLNITPFISPELYMGVNLLGVNLLKFKTIIGVDYRFNKQNHFKLYYRNDRELSQILPYTYHSLGISYNLSL
ncbi:MAG: DUF2490 domain-containing protein [Prolixibacteraceae bacterium]|jgi:hypothetical protein|nr:DUF2490 domain-containing protein [Prolixibacteraceae bacterium]